MIVAGRQLDPELREPLAHLARASGFPILAEPTSQLRCGPHDRSHVVAAYDLLLRDEHFARSVVPDLVLRFGEMPTSKPLRAWLAARGADQIVVDPDGGWNEPTSRAAAILRADPTELAAGWAARLESRNRAASPSAGSRPRRRRSEALDDELGGRRRTDRAGPAPCARRSPPRRRPRLHRLEHADPRPGGVPAAGRDRRPLPLQPRRQRDRRPALLRASAPPTPAAGRPRSSPATSACSTTSAASPPCATSRPRSASSSSTTTAAASSTSCPRPRRCEGGVRGAARHPARRRRRGRGRALRPPPPAPRVAGGPPDGARRRHRPDRGHVTRPTSSSPASPPRRDCLELERRLPGEAPQAGEIHSMDALRASTMFLLVPVHAAGILSAQRPPRRLGGRDLLGHPRLPLAPLLRDVGFLPCPSSSPARACGDTPQNRTLRIAVPLAIGLVVTDRPLMTVASQATGITVTGDGRTPARQPVDLSSPRFLWFLWYLLILDGMAVALYMLAPGRLATSGTGGRGRRSLSLTMGARLACRANGSRRSGRRTRWTATPRADSFVPDPSVLAYYTIFFGLGATLCAHRRLVGAASRSPGGGQPARLRRPFLPRRCSRSTTRPPAVPIRVIHGAGLLLYAVATWTSLLALVGLANRYLDRPRPGAALPGRLLLLDLPLAHAGDGPRRRAARDDRSGNRRPVRPRHHRLPRRLAPPPIRSWSATRRSDGCSTDAARERESVHGGVRHSTSGTPRSRPAV